MVFAVKALLLLFVHCPIAGKMIKLSLFKTGKTICYLNRRALSQFVFVLCCIAACLNVYCPLTVFAITADHELNGNSFFSATQTKECSLQTEFLNSSYVACSEVYIEYLFT